MSSRLDRRDTIRVVEPSDLDFSRNTYRFGASEMRETSPRRSAAELGHKQTYPALLERSVGVQPHGRHLAIRKAAPQPLHRAEAEAGQPPMA